MKYLNFIFLTLIIAILSASWAHAQDSAPLQPLFPVGLGHDFRDSEETFKEVKKLILDNYYTEDISEEALYWAAIEGMLRHISPPENKDLAKIWTAEDYQKVLDGLKGEQVSIGIKSSFNASDGSLTVTEVMPGSPAENILMANDRIMKIGTEMLKGKSVKEINDLLDGEEGTDVTMTINREIQIFDVTIKRKRFDTENLIVTRLADSIALVEIKRFTEGMFEKLRDEINGLRDGNFRRLIIDLRNDPGGVFMEPLRISELFLPEKNILLRTYTREKKNQNYVSVNKEPLDFEIAVLVNGKTASSAEILAGSLRDHQKAFIIGTKTYGKGVFEKTFTLKNDYRVKFITGVMYTPRGDAWQGKGLLPDFVVDQDDKTVEALLKLDVNDRLKKDVALITAVKLLKLRGAN
ncbi:MAG: PDZ domain-containing protein [Nitrospirae bacterium]|nr:PDZ domain-containing protein [Nitrospirota bacterium]